MSISFISLVALLYVLYITITLKRRVKDLEDTIHAVYQDMDLKVDELRSKIKDGEEI